MKKLFFATLSFLSVHAAFAVDYSLPTITTAQPNTAGPAGWVSNLYQFSLMAAGILAFGVIVYAGFLYTLKSGNPSAQGDAKDQITQALLGLLLLLGAFLILNTINPGLTKLEVKGLTPIQTQTTTNNAQSDVSLFQCLMGGAPTGGCFPNDQAGCRRQCAGGTQDCAKVSECK